MPNAVDMFRAQRDAAEAVQRTLHDTTTSLNALRQEVDRLVGDEHLRGLLRDERALLDRTDAFLHQVRCFREREIAWFWPAAWRRWLVAVAFALASATAAGAGYTWMSRPDASERARARARRNVADAIIQRIETMTPAERRQLDALMKGATSQKLSGATGERRNVESSRAER